MTIPETCSQKQCGDGSCIAERLICDKNEQCDLGIDEDYCSKSLKKVTKQIQTSFRSVFENIH